LAEVEEGGAGDVHVDPGFAVGEFFQELAGSDGADAARRVIRFEESTGSSYLSAHLFPILVPLATDKDVSGHIEPQQPLRMPMRGERAIWRGGVGMRVRLQS
jgi:hypothetical protein